VRELSAQGHDVGAGVRSRCGGTPFVPLAGVRTVQLDILDGCALRKALAGFDQVYHFAAATDPEQPRKALDAVNVVGTRNVWEVAASSGVTRALYCSSAAVYGLLSRSRAAIDEKVLPRAIEPYGNSKLLGEQAALDVASCSGLHTTIIRPVAIFGPGDRSLFGRQLRRAANRKLLIPGGFEYGAFNFVHVEDVAAAAVHLMSLGLAGGEIFNVAVNRPIRFDEAFQVYRRVLARAGRRYRYLRMLAAFSTLVHRLPSMLKWLPNVLRDRCAFSIWHPGFDLSYSAAKLEATDFRFKWTRFEDVLSSCLGVGPPLCVRASGQAEFPSG
jgi:nucleoside-diphosphate-sugar epimerase